jgi:hypothetical protein
VFKYEGVILIKPDFHRLWLAFPDHIKYPTLKDLYPALGGTAKKNIMVPGFGPNGNTCASRLSVAFNKAGSPINTALANVAGAKTIGTEDGSRIIYQVAGFRNYLLEFLQNRSERLSVASSRNTETGVYLRVNEDFEYRIGVNHSRAVGSARSLLKLLGDTFSPYDGTFRGRRGIIAFSVNWQGATGHIALWNGTHYREPGHDNYSTYIDPNHPDIKTSRGEFWEIK